MMKNIITSLLAEAAGWYGLFAVVGAYALLTFGVLTVDALPYQLLNLTGAIGLGIVAFRNADWQPAILQVVWGLIALVAIARVLT